MRKRVSGSMIAVAVVAAVFSLAERAATGQARPAGVSRTADGKPNLTGVWQALNTANWDLQDHAARQGPVIALGAAFSVPAGRGVVEGGEIPYKPAALAKKKENGEHWLTLDPEIKCFLPGIPRATYLPYPFQIVQTPARIVMAYEFAHANRTIPLNVKLGEAPVDSWMGMSSGRWEGDTLVVDVTGFNDQTWFDRAGNFHSDALHVVERFTPRGPDAITYEATMEDPEVFTRPWKISMPLYRRLEKDVQLLEYRCVEFAEELMYGHLRKQVSK